MVKSLTLTVAWMDTSLTKKETIWLLPTVLMEILFKSVSLGGRYNIMAGGAMRPVQQLIENMTLTGATHHLDSVNYEPFGMKLTIKILEFCLHLAVHMMVSVMLLWFQLCSLKPTEPAERMFINPSADANQSWVNNPTNHH